MKNPISESPKIRTKINFILFNSIFIMMIFLTVYNYYSTKSDLVESLEEKLLSDIDLSRAYVESKYPGEWVMIDNELHRGELNLVGNTEIVDDIGALTKGNYVSLFQNDVRISTNVIENGDRALNTKVSSNIADIVIGQKERYIGTSNIVGEETKGVYDPILDANGNVIGIWATAISTAPYIAIAQGNLWVKIVVSSLMMFITITIISLYVDRKVARPLTKLRANANDLADLNLNANILEIKGNDEIAGLAQAFKSVQIRIKETIGVVSQSAAKVANSSQLLADSSFQTSDASSQISKTMSAIATGTAEQSDRVDTILQMMNGTIVEVTECLRKAEQALVNATDSSEIARQGEAAISDAIKHLRTVTQTVTYATDSIQKLGKRSEEIGGIITVITSIADQTNLLALNAAIEAARAGDQGKGFAVVAAEVRQLAEQSRTASGQITELISDIQAETSVTVRTMESNLQAVQEQVTIINKGGEALEEIVSRVSETEDSVGHMKTAFEHVNENSHKVQVALQEMTMIIETAAASTQQVAATSEEQFTTIEEITTNSDELAKVANSLREEVSKFQL